MHRSAGLQPAWPRRIDSKPVANRRSATDTFAFSHLRVSVQKTFGDKHPTSAGSVPYLDADETRVVLVEHRFSGVEVITANSQG